MRKWMNVLTTCSLGLVITASAVMLFAFLAEGQVTSQATDLQNPGFEGEYVAWEGSDETKIAPSWNLWYKLDWPGETDWLAVPKAESVPSPTHEGSAAQHLYAQAGTIFDACLYQQVSGITVGHFIQFSAWGRIDTGLETSKAQTRIGIDPEGRTDPLAIQYELHPENWDVFTAANDQWQKLQVTMRATSPTATLYVCAHPMYRDHFNVYWDDAAWLVTSSKDLYMPAVSYGHWVLPPGELYNPGMEREYYGFDDYWVPDSNLGNAKVAMFWHPFADESYKLPEFGYTDRGYRVHSGQVAQQFGQSAWGAFRAGLYQVVTGTYDAGDTLRFRMWGMGWSSTRENQSNEHYSDVREGLNFRVGINPYGGQSYTSTNIVWSSFYDPYDVWEQLEVTTTLTETSSKISVWVYANPAADWNKQNQTFWDDGWLEVIDAP